MNTRLKILVSDLQELKDGLNIVLNLKLNGEEREIFEKAITNLENLIDKFEGDME